jgi:hypothetical protein
MAKHSTTAKATNSITTSRRVILQTLIGTAAAVSSVAACAASGDLDLVQLAERITVAYAEDCRAIEIVDALHGKFLARRPERPAALRWRVTDPVGYWSQHLPNGKCAVWCNEVEAEKWRGQPFTRKQCLGSDEIPDESGQRRIDEILAAYDAYEVEVTAIKAELGLDVAEDRAREIGDHLWDMTRELFERPALTIEGMRAKARIVRLHGWAEDNPDDTSEQAVLSLVNDLIGVPAVIEGAS